MLRRGRLIAVPPLEKALRFLESEGEVVGQPPPGRRTIVGAIDQVRAQARGSSPTTTAPTR